MSSQTWTVFHERKSSKYYWKWDWAQYMFVTRGIVILPLYQTEEMSNSGPQELQPANNVELP